MNAQAQDIFERLMANTDDFLEHRVEYPEFSKKNKALWGEAQVDPALNAQVQKLVGDLCLREMSEAMRKVGP